MRFANPRAMLRSAREHGYAVPAFNTNGGGYDLTRAALEAAQQTAAPLILQVYEPNTAYRGFRFFVEQARWLGDELGVRVPVAVQLDHGRSVDSALRAMRAGFTAVMFDASHEPLDVNIRRTRRVLEATAALDVAVEAEVGCVRGNEAQPQTQLGRVSVPERPTADTARTSVEQAREFLEQAPVDMLAVAIGTTHGVYQCQDELDFERLRELRRAVDTPLVMHGTSGIAPENLARLAREGMAKVNFGEPFRYNFIRYFTQLTDSMEHLWHPWRILREVKNRLKRDMIELIHALGAEGRAGV